MKGVIPADRPRERWHTFLLESTGRFYQEHAVWATARVEISLVLFRTNETAFVQTKRKLLDDCELWCIVSLPAGTFVNAGAGVKANLLFFTKGQPTQAIWYYDLSDIKVGKKTPLTLAHFEEFFRLLPQRADSERSWTVPRAEIEKKNFDLKAVNPHAKTNEDTRTPEELLDLIEAKGREVLEALAALRRPTKML